MKMKLMYKKIITAIITWEAKLVIKKYKPTVIAVIGSVGKTSTKDAIFTVLSKYKKVRKSEKSYNSEIGLPLTILGLPNAWSDPFIWIENILSGIMLIVKKQPYPDILVLEVGVGKVGDIKKNVLPWLKVDILVVTRFPDKPVHVEFFGSTDKLIEEKSAMVKAIKKGGLLILNQDDEKVYALHESSKERAVSFGQDENSTYRILYPNYSFKKFGKVEVPRGINFRIQYKGNVFPVILPLVVGLHNTMQASSAIACANELGIDILESIKAVSEFETPPGRLSLIEGVKHSLVIDDTYNSSPTAAHEAIEILKEFKGGRKIAVLGDMLELGKYTEEEHRNLGKEVSAIAGILITVGPRAKLIGEEALNIMPSENVYSFDETKDAISFVSGMVEEGDIFLVKGSQRMRLERLVEAIMKDKDKKGILLCRQDKEWGR